MKLAITAANGQLGSSIIQACVQRYGVSSVVGICRDPGKASDLPCEVRQASYGDKAKLGAALSDIDAICMVSLNGDPGKRLPLHRNVVNMAKQAGVKRFVYTSIMGEQSHSGALWNQVIRSNRDTEKIIMDAGIEYVIGRNGLYIEPDIAYLEEYRKEGKIVNCAGDGRCSYTTRGELGAAYARMLVAPDLGNQVLNLCGDPLTQTQLATLLNQSFATNLIYEEVSTEEYLLDRKKALGDLMGQIIAGIYTAIKQENNIATSDFEKAAGRPHIPWKDYFENLKQVGIQGI